MLRVCVLGALLLVVACVRSNSQTCGDGTICPHDTVCFTAGNATTCVDPRLTCEGEGTECATASTCHGGLCVPSVCGNRVLDFGEDCDLGDVASGDGCSSDCDFEVCGNGATDLGEACDDNNQLSHDGCSSECTVEQPRWTLSIEGQPPPRTHYAMVFDTIRRRFLVFGGMEAGSGNHLGDTAEWDPRAHRWNGLASALAPAPRHDHAMAFDPDRGVTVLFGGTNGGVLGDTWEFDGTRWIQRAAIGPSARFAHTMVYDGRRRRVVLFGGSNKIDNFRDTWEWNGASWTELATAVSPPARRNHAMAFDSAHGLILLQGGETKVDDLGDTWALDSDGWREIAATDGPGQRQRHAMAFTPKLDDSAPPAGVILVGGFHKGEFKNDVWSFDGTGWQPAGLVYETHQTSPMGPTLRTHAPMADHAIATDPFEKQVLLMSTARAEQQAIDINALLEFEPSLVSDDVWQETIEVVVDKESVPEREGAVIAFDPLSQLAVMFGGQDIGSTAVVDDTLVWRGQWSVPSSITTGPGVQEPSPRRDASASFDGKRVVLFGGGTPGGVELADTWLYEITLADPEGAWKQHDPDGLQPAPSARRDAMVTYDAGNREMLLFGGRGPTPQGVQYLADTWRWDGATQQWRELATTGVPPPRTEAGFAYDPVTRRAILFGGFSGDSALGDTWILDPGTAGQGATWTEITTPLAPLPRHGAPLAWSASRRAVLLFGGRHGSMVEGVVANDTWEATWNTAGQFEWTQLDVAPPEGRSHHGIFTMLDGATYIVHGQYAGAGAGFAFRPDVWRLRYDSGTRDELCTGIDSDGDGLVGCDDPDCWSRCTPLCEPLAEPGTCDTTSRCGDEICNPTLEGCSLCPDDCFACSNNCGDFVCTGTDATTCSGDCPP